MSGNNCERRSIVLHYRGVEIVVSFYLWHIGEKDSGETWMETVRVDAAGDIKPLLEPDMIRKIEGLIEVRI